MSHRPGVYVLTTASYLYNNNFLVHFCCKRVWSMEPNFHKFQHPHYHLVQVVVGCFVRVLVLKKHSSTEDSWIQRQVEINWRFKHIYSIVDFNPQRPGTNIGDPLIQFDKPGPAGSSLLIIQTWSLMSLD